MSDNMVEFEESIDNSFDPEYQTIDEIHENLEQISDDNFSVGEVIEIVMKKKDNHLEEDNIDIDETKGLNKIKSFIKKRFRK